MDIATDYKEKQDNHLDYPFMEKYLRILGQFPKGYSGISHSLLHLKFRHDKALGNVHLGNVC